MAILSSVVRDRAHPPFLVYCVSHLCLFFFHSAIFGGRRYGAWLIEGRHFFSRAVIDLVVDGVTVLRRSVPVLIVALDRSLVAPPRASVENSVEVEAE